MDLLQMSIQGAAMILAVALVRTLFLNKLPKGVFMVLWAVVMLRLLVPFDIPLPVSAWSIAERATNAATVAPGSSAAALPGEPQLAQVNAYAAQLASDYYAELAAGQAGSLGAGGVQGGQGVSATGPAAADAGGIWERVTSWLAGVDLGLALWVLGLVLIALFFVGQYLYGLGDFRWSVPARHPFAQQWLEQHPLRRPLVIRVHDTLRSPMTYGLFKPVILVPKTFDWEDRGGASYMLMHEWVHVWRWDAVYKLALTAALVLHWFNPAVWLMYSLANRDIELACDERVVRLLGPGGRKAYAHTLIDMAEKNGALAPLASGFGKSAIEERIVAIVNVKRMTGAAALGSLALAAGITVAFAASPAPIEEAEQEGVANPGAFVQAGGVAGEVEALAYDAYMEEGCGATRLVTPWYSTMVEDSLFPNGLTYEYDEAGLGFYTDGTTEACSVLRVFDRGTGALTYMVYLSSTPALTAPFTGSYVVAQGPQLPEYGLHVMVARPYNAALDGARAYSQRLVTTLRSRVSTDTASHLVRDPAAGVTTIKTGHYDVAIPDDLLGEGWCYTLDAPMRDDAATGTQMGMHLTVMPGGDQGAAFGVHLTNGAGLQGEYAAQTLHTYDGASGWAGYSVVAYKPADFGAHTYDEELELLAPYASCVTVNGTVAPLSPEVFSAWEDGDLRVVTPHYSVLVPGELVGTGFDYAYVEGMPAIAAQGADFYRSHITEIYLERTTRNQTWYDVYCYREGVTSDNGAQKLVQAPAGLVSGDALSIGVDVEASDDSTYDAEASKAYAMTVRLSRVQPAWGGAPGSVDGERLLATIRNELVQVQQEGADTRLVTPYYSLLVPGGMLAEGWEFSYDAGVYDDTGGGEHLRGNILSIYVPGSSDPVFYVHCASRGWDGAVGAVATANVGASLADASWDIVACYPYAGSAADLERGMVSYEDAVSYANLIGGHIAAA